MAVTRINNNQISDAASGNAAAGINASTKVQDYSITGGKLANNLTYGNNLTVTGNLTVQGNTTQIDTDIITVEDPLILLASNQTGTPTLDIGFIGQRGNAENIAFVWEESADAFVTAFTSTGESNTTITVTSYANLITGNANVTSNLSVVGTTSLVGNIISDANVTGNINSASVNTVGNISATGQITGGNVSAVGLISGGNVSVSGNVTSANLTVGPVTILNTGAISGVTTLDANANITTTGNLTGNAVYANAYYNANGSPFGTSAAGGNTQVQYNAGSNAFGASSAFTFDYADGANLLTAGNITSSGALSAVGTATVGNLSTAGTVSATGNITTANGIIALGNSGFGDTGSAGVYNAYIYANGVANVKGVSATGNITGGNVLTGGLISATGTITSAANVIGGNLSTAGSLFVADSIAPATPLTTITGGTISAAGNVTANAVNAVNLSLSGNILSNASVQPGSFFIGDGAYISNISGANVSSTKITNGNSQANIGTSGGNLDITIGGNSTAQFYDVGLSVFGNVTLNAAVNAANLSLTGNVLSALNVDGNITGANISTGGILSVTGTATVGNVDTGGTISATANITGGNVLTGGVVSATANIIGGNLTTIGDVSASGNVYGNAVVTDLITTDTVLVIETTAGNSGISIQPNGNGNINVNTHYINNVATPEQANDAANKQYVDDVAAGLNVHDSTQAATPNTLAVISGGTVSYNNGNAGVGANLVTTGTYTNIDGVAINTVGTRILVKDEANTAWNGIYTYSNATVLVRATDYNSVPEVEAGDFVFNLQGNVYGNTGWVQVSNTQVMGTDPIVFTQFSGAGQYSGGNGIAINGLVISTLFDGNTVGINGSNQLYIPANAPLVTPNIGAATGTSLSVTGNVDAGNVNTGGLISAAGNVTGNAINGVNLSLSGNVIGNLTVDTNVVANNVLATTSFSTAGNVIAGNVNSANLSLTGNVISALNVTTDITANNVYAVNAFSAGGNVTAANFTTTGASGNITGANVIASTTLSATGNLISGNVNTGNISLSGNVLSTLNVDGNIKTANFFIGDGGFISNINAANVAVTKIVNGGSYANVTSSDGNVVVAVGNASNVAATFFDSATGAGMSAAGNVLVGNLILESGPDHQISVANGATLQITGSATVAFASTGSINGSSGNIETPGVISATGNVTGGNISTAGLVTGGNISTAGNVTANAVNAVNLSLSGNILSNASVQPGSFFIGDGYYISNINAANVSTTKISNGNSQANIGQVDGNLDITINGNATAQFYDVGLSVFGDVTLNAAVNAANLSLSGNVLSALNVDGNITTANVNATTQVITPIITNPGSVLNIGTAGNTSVAINGASANLVFVDGVTDSVSIGSNVQTTNAILALNATSSFLVPVGNTAQRPATGITGMQRFNTTTGYLEMYNGTVWDTIGGSPTVINDQQFSGDGNQTVFTLSSAQTTNSCLVSINGVVQVPTLAYSVVGTTLTFTEAPAVGDHIDVREITTTTTVTGISNTSGNAAVGVNDASANVAITGNLVVGAGAGYLYGDGTYLTNVGGGNVIATKIQEGTSSVDIDGSGGNIITTVANSAVLVTSPAQTTITGNFNPSANATYTLGNSTNQWSNLWISGNTIFIGGSNISANTTTLSFGGQPIVTQNANGNISGGNVTATTISSSGNVTGGNIRTGGVISATGNITGSYIIGNGSQLTGLPAGYSNADVATYLSSGTVTANILTTGLISATGNVQGGNFRLSGGQFYVSNGPSVATLTGSAFAIDGTVSASGNVTAGNLSVVGNTTITGNSVTIGSGFNTISLQNGTVSVNGNVQGGNIQGATLSTYGNITGANLSVGNGTITVGNIVTLGNVAGNIGSSTNYFNTVFAKATSAQYADLAEKYTADAEYTPGTVVAFGGELEVTASTTNADPRVAGVVSTNPSYIMNGTLEGTNVVTVALTGRVPTSVTGTVRKGDLMVSNGDGTARAEADPRVGTVIGKALENFDGATGIIEVVVGRV